MEKYVKLIDGKIVEAPVNKDGIINYNLSPELMIEDGYKLFIEAEVPPDTEIRMYHFEYQENEDNIQEIIVYDETIEEAQDRIKRIDKENKINEINEKIEELEKMAQYDILYNNQENIQVYRDVINGLENTRDNL